MPSREPGAAPASSPCSPDTTHDGERAELQRQGAKAAARGEPRESNPMLESINRPQSTGESHAAWGSRRDAWEQGRAAQEYAPVPTDRPAGAQEAFGGAADETRFGVTRVLTFAGSKGLTAASGFFFERDGRLFLVTSRHVLFDAPSGHAPDRIEIDRRDRVRILADRDLAGIVFDEVARQFGGEPGNARQRQQRMARELVADRERF